jgi:hypothetical protein
MNLSAEQLEHFNYRGWLLVDTLTSEETTEVQKWVADIASWADVDGEWLHYRELTDYGPKLCRTENFTPFHSGMHQFLRSGQMVAVASQLLGSEAVLYKEKINYKLAGGAGYSPHQDAPAYRFIETHISCMVAVDDATAENGCLEVVSGLHHEILPMDSKGCIDPALVATFHWMTVPLRAGQTLWFHSRTPHRSGANHSQKDRRALYPTYNALSEGDLRSRYYEQKLKEFAESKENNESVRVSLIGDFEGKPVR